MLSNPSLIRAVTAGTPLAGSSALQGEDTMLNIVNFSYKLEWNVSKVNTTGLPLHIHCREMFVFLV